MRARGQFVDGAQHYGVHVFHRHGLLRFLRQVRRNDGLDDGYFTGGRLRGFVLYYFLLSGCGRGYAQRAEKNKRGQKSFEMQGRIKHESCAVSDVMWC